jgi:50S ribosomal protein L16 3-hydroxylase
MTRALASPLPAQRALGEWLTEPKAQVWFEPGESWQPGQGVRLDRRSRMLYDRHHIFCNGESWRAGGADARMLKKLADHGRLSDSDLRQTGAEVRALLQEWCEAGWVRAE